MDEDEILFKGNGEPKQLSPSGSTKGGSRRPPAKKASSGYIESSGNSRTNDNERAGNMSSLMTRAAATGIMSKGNGEPMDMTTLDEDKTEAACHEFKFGNNKVSDALLARLSELGATAPWLVDLKRLQSTDARVNQNRLQLSSRRSISGAFFTDAEKDRARTPDGMSVTAFDRSGREYAMTCKLWKNDKHYRFMGQGWKRFREAHGLTIAKEEHLTRRVTVELWAFRSRALRWPPQGEGGEEPGQPDGAIGLVILLRDDGVKEEVAVAVKEEVAEEAAPEEERYRSWFLLLMAGVGLMTLRTMVATKRKRDDD